MRLDIKSLAVLTQKLFQAFAGLATLYCIALFLSPSEQGYYYTFASLAALQTLLEMGLATVLIQQAAHEFVHLAWAPKGRLLGPMRERFLALVKRSLLWYAVAAMIFSLAYPGGFWFFADKISDSNLQWQQPWLLLVLSTASNLLFMPVLALVEGSGRVVEIYTLRSLQTLAGALATWIVLVNGGGLYAVAMMPLFSGLLAGFWLLLRYPWLLIQALGQSSTAFDWWKDVWPLQWRLGISWLCSYLLTQIHTPLLFKTQNPIVSGQMGLTLTFCNMLGILSLSWMTSRVPLLAGAVAKRDLQLLDKEFSVGFSRSLSIFVLGAVIFVGVRYLADFTIYGVRFLPFYETLGLVVAIFFIHVSGLFAVYLRAHRQEPFMKLMLISALLTAGLAVFVAPRWGSAGIISVLLLINVGLGFPVSFLVFRRLRALWHAD